MMTRILQLCTVLLLGLCASVSQAANYAGTEFEIELIVFSRHKGMELSRETWPAAPKLQYPSRWVDFQSPAGDPAVPALTPAATRLDNKVAALKRGGDYQVLFHKAWRQVLVGERNAPAILVSGGDSFREHQQLEGSITLSVSRYLHLSTDLWFNQFATTGDATGIPLPPRPRATAGEPLNLLASSSLTAVHADHVAVLREERRMKSGELHYIDHPQLGVLIEVRKVEAGEAAP